MLKPLTQVERDLLGYAFSQSMGDSRDIGGAKKVVQEGLAELGLTMDAEMIAFTPQGVAISVQANIANPVHERALFALLRPDLETDDMVRKVAVAEVKDTAKNMVRTLPEIFRELADSLDKTIEANDKENGSLIRYEAP